jgi:hypothetical protein
LKRISEYTAHMNQEGPGQPFIGAIYVKVFQKSCEAEEERKGGDVDDDTFFNEGKSAIFNQSVVSKRSAKSRLLDKRADIKQ